MQTLKAVLTPVAINNPLELRESGRHQGLKTPAGTDLDRREAGQDPPVKRENRHLAPVKYFGRRCSPSVSCHLTFAEKLLLLGVWHNNELA